MTEAEFNSFFDVLQCTSEQLLQALTSVQHLRSLQKNRKCICKLITTRITAQTRLTVCSCSDDEENLQFEQGENHSDQFLLYLIRFGAFLRLGVDSSHQMFFINSTLLKKGWQVPKVSCPKGDSVCLTQTHTPAQEAFKLGLKTFCISFSFARINDASFAMLTLALVDQGTGCLRFACSFPWGPALLPGRASSCLPLNKKCCAQPTLGEGERFLTSTWAPPGI